MAHTVKSWSCHGCQGNPLTSSSVTCCLIFSVQICRLLFFAFFFISASNSFPRKASITEPMEGLNRLLLLEGMICDFMQFPVDFFFFFFVGVCGCVCVHVWMCVFFPWKTQGNKKCQCTFQDNMHWDGMCCVRCHVASVQAFWPPPNKVKYMSREKTNEKSVCKHLA